MTGAIAGVVVLTATTSTVTLAPVSKDRHVCGASATVESAWLDLVGRALDGVIVHLDAPPRKGALSPARLVIDQRNCTYLPRVAALPLRSVVRFTSSDPVLHNVHLFDPAGKTLGNWAMPAKGQTTPWVRLSRAGRYRVACDAGHVWMNAHIVAFDHPYFATSAKGGRFRIGRVPPGRHRLVAWHPDLGERVLSVDVPSTGSVDVRIEF
jgi:plastocyanin